MRRYRRSDRDKRLPTKEKLAQVLHARGLFSMEAEARTGRYDDFLSDHPTPIQDLVRDLRAAGAEDLAQRAIAGEWDATKEESEAWINSAEGRAAVAELTKADKT